ncbi:hypothetical protein [Blastococcus sp. SYSU DS0617]
MDHELGLTLIPVTGTAADADRVREAAVDGFVLWTTVDDDPLLDVVSELGVPAVVHGGPRVDGMALVSVDDRAAARAVGGATFAGSRSPAVVSFPWTVGGSPRCSTGPTRAPRRSR